MIKLDISLFIFFYTLCSVIIIMIMWIMAVYRDKKKLTPKYPEYAWRCSVCAHAYIDSKHDDISACPLCGSFNKRNIKEDVS